MSNQSYSASDPRNRRVPLKPRGEPQPNIVYTYFHFQFHFQVNDNMVNEGALSNEFQNNST